MSRDDRPVFKVFLENTGVKKFRVNGDISVITNLVYVKELLRTHFPILLDAKFRLTWRDIEDDDILIENDEDLIMAFTEMDTLVKTLYVSVLSGHNASHTPQCTHRSTRTIYQACNRRAPIYRFTCLRCFNNDQYVDRECCERHSYHGMLSTPELHFTRCGRKVVEDISKAEEMDNYTAYNGCKGKPKWGFKSECSCASSWTDQACFPQECAPHPETAYASVNGSSKTVAATGVTGPKVPTQQLEPPTQTDSEPESNEEQPLSIQIKDVFQKALDAYAHSDISQPPTRHGESMGTSAVPVKSGSQIVEVFRAALNSWNDYDTSAVPSLLSESEIVHPQSSDIPQASSPPAETEIDESILMDAVLNGLGPLFQILKELQAVLNAHGIQITIDARNNQTEESGASSLSSETEMDLTQSSPTDEPADTYAAPGETEWTIVPVDEQIPQLSIAVPPSQESEVQVSQEPQAPQAPQAAEAYEPSPLSEADFQPAFSAPSISREHIKNLKIAVGLRKMREMGFHEANDLIGLLRYYNGNVDEVLKHIFENK